LILKPPGTDMHTYDPLGQTDQASHPPWDRHVAAEFDPIGQTGRVSNPPGTDIQRLAHPGEGRLDRIEF